LARLRFCFALLAFAGCADSTICAPPRELSEIPLLRLGHEEIVPVEIDGEPAGLMLDTGVQVTTVTPQAVHELHLSRFGGFGMLAGIGGVVLTPAFTIDALKIGATTVIGEPALVIPLSNSPLDAYPVYGLLGQDILSHWDLDFDAAHDMLRLYAPQRCDDPPAPWGGPAQTVRMPVTEPRTTDTLTVSLDGNAIDAVLDTGASSSIVTRSAAGLTAASLRNDPADHAFGIGPAAIAVRAHRFGNLGIGSASYGPATLAVTSRLPHGLGMLLGEDFLHRHRVYIAWRSRRLLIAP
jgi:predicted aspartyl protease